jgi:transposase
LVPLEQNSHFVWIDEFGVSLSTQRQFGHSTSGNSAIQIVTKTVGTIMSTLCSISSVHRILKTSSQEILFDMSSFSIYFHDLYIHLQGLNKTNICFIMDNYRIHNKQALSLEVMQYKFQVEFLPAYISMLNLIEEIFKDIKHLIGTRFSTSTRNQILGIASLPCGLKTKVGVNIVSQAISLTINGINDQQILAHNNISTRRFLLQFNNLIFKRFFN